MFPYLTAAFLGWSLGANDASNAFGTAVSSRMVPFRLAAILTAIFALLGACLQGAHGIRTLESITSQTAATALTCGLAAAVTVTIMTFLRLPVSASQAVVGAIVGMGLLRNDVNWLALRKVVLCWIGTPIGAALMCVLVCHGLRRLFRIGHPSIFAMDPVIRFGLLLCGCYGAYALGANNVANVTAVFAGSGQMSIPEALVFGGISIGLGALTFSRGVMLTVGRGLVRLDAFSALCAVLAAAITVHAYAVIGVPVSTSQAIVGAVLGIGLMKGWQTVRVVRLVWVMAGWILTPGLALAFAMLFHAVVSS